tara:strand:+ start:105 stop:1235 length:1131 start_codon:yes stop_codon:yes gene_type:complete
MIAVSWLVLEKTGSEFTLGKVIAISTLPGLVISIFTGYIIDKFNRKFLLVYLDIIRAFIIIIFLIYLNFYQFNIKYLYPLVFFMGIFNSIFWSTAQAFAQEVVSKKDYFNANKLLSASYQIGSILGAGIGGIVVHIFNPFNALWINSFTYIVSAILIFIAPYIHQKKENLDNNFLKSNFKGIEYLFNKKKLLTLLTTTIMSDVAIWGALSVLTLSISIQVYDKGTWGYGLLDGFYGVGALFSVILVGFCTKYLSRRILLKICYLFSFIALFLSAKMASIFIASIFFLILGLCNNSARIIVRTILMENVKNNIMGRVQTFLGIYTRLLVVFSSLFCGYLIEKYNIEISVIFTCFHYFIAFSGVWLISYQTKKSFSFK